MANTLNLIQPTFYTTSLPGTQPYLKGDVQATGSENYYKETAGQTFKINDLLQLDTNGTVAICGLSSNSLNTPILGQAQSPATGVTGNPILVRVIRGDDLFRMSVWHATAASAVTAQTQLGTIFRVRFDSAALPAGTGGNWVVDIQNTTVEDATTALAKVQVVGFYQGRVFTNDAPSKEVTPVIGDIYGQVVVRFVPFTVQTNGAGLVRNLYF